MYTFFDARMVYRATPHASRLTPPASPSGNKSGIFPINQQSDQEKIKYNFAFLLTGFVNLVSNTKSRII
jgi:hypothetical protein